MDVKELLALYAAGERSFYRISLWVCDDDGDITFDDPDLSGINFINASLSCSFLFRVNLSNADLRYTNFRSANLSCANLSNANLYGANLSGANLSNANLYGANLTASSLIGTVLNEANLQDADLTNANLAETDLTKANLNGTKLDGTIFFHQKLVKELQQENRRLTRRINILKATLERRERNEVNNQGVNALQKWQGFYFRSQPEIQIAGALDQAGVLFYPNCKARLSTSVGRGAKETDFLVFYQGKWGILEVDGEPWHPPSRVVHDHERDRLFKVHGIRVVEHYDANRCSRQPDEVVAEFLKILRQA